MNPDIAALCRALLAGDRPGRAEAMALVTEVERLTKALDDYRATFDLRWKADMRGVKLWRAANPGNELVMPDHADMVCWLLDQLDAHCGALALSEKELAARPVAVLTEEERAAVERVKRWNELPRGCSWQARYTVYPDAQDLTRLNMAHQIDLRLVAAALVRNVKGESDGN